MTQEVVGPSVVVTVVVGVGEDDEVEVLTPVVVDSSRQPHHPGVLHVVVLVKLVVLVLLLMLVDVVVSDPLLSKYFQLKQSIHSSSGMHKGNSS